VRSIGQHIQGKKAITVVFLQMWEEKNNIEKNFADH
jgi:hypothetical protein